MKKIFLSLIAFVVINQVMAQTGMLNFQQDLSGSSGGGSGTGVPIDGGLSAMIVGTAAYGYKMMKKRKSKKANNA
jgi:hypothetical protein